jgi:energy-coupling factor transport system ATP-binding protein
MQEGRIVYDIEPKKLINSKIIQELGLRDLSESSFVANPISENVDDCLVGIEKSSIEYRSGFQLYIDHFYANPGKKMGLIGPNGCGKTTILKVLSGLKKVKKGKTIPVKIKPGELSTLVYQQTDNQLFMDTVEKEVYKFSRNHELATKLISHFGLEHLKHYSPFSLSEGEKQRVVLAASIGRNVPVLLLDEPTTGMDGFQLDNFMKLLDSDYLKDTACIIASHDKQLLKIATHEQYFINSKN